MEVKKIDNYIILDEISESMSLLYKAKDEHLDKIVALKVLPEKYEKNPLLTRLFEKEFKNLASLDHPNIITIHHAGKIQNRWYFTMEWIEGLDLKKYIMRHGPIELNKGTLIMRQVAHALSYAHKHDIIHRDIKSSNILIKEAGNKIKAYVTDFGISKDIKARTDGRTLTTTTGVIGTLDYMPPEQALAQKNKIGPASDVYALGCVVYEMFTGRVPFKADTDPAVVQMHINTPPAPLSDFNPTIPNKVERVVLKALEKEPRDRFQSTWQFYLALNVAKEKASNVTPTPSPPHTPTPRGTPALIQTKSYNWIYPVSAAVALGMGVLMFFVGQYLRNIL